MTTAPTPIDPVEIIHRYTRRQALLDGVLVALPRAHVVGFRVPVAITAAAAAVCIDWEVMDPTCPDTYTLRELAVLNAAMTAARAQIARERNGTEEEGGDRITFGVSVPVDDGSGRMIEIALQMLIGPGDDARPVGTILLLGED
jgi:hypothetical protein